MVDRDCGDKPTGARRIVVLWAVALLLVAAIVPLLHEESAFGLGGVVLEKTYFGQDDSDAVSPEPSPVWYASLQFSKNVGYAAPDADDSFIQQNLEKVHLVDAAGNEVPGAQFYTGGSREERQLIYLAIDDWLAPLSEYRIIVDEGIAAANLEDKTTIPYEVAFKTTDALPWGVGLIQVACIAAACCVVLAGVVVQVVRRVRSR